MLSLRLEGLSECYFICLGVIPRYSTYCLLLIVSINETNQKVKKKIKSLRNSLSPCANTSQNG